MGRGPWLELATTLWLAGCAGPTTPPVEMGTVHVEPPPTVHVAEVEPPPAASAPAEPEDAETAATADEAPSEGPPPGLDARSGVSMVVGMEIRTAGQVAFETAKDLLRPESDLVLASVDRILKTRPDITLMRIEVHTDSMGASVMNQVLSERRSLAVARWFVARGIDCRRLVPTGFGETKPLGDNTTAEGRARNRRTTFHLAALRGKPVAGAPVDGGGRVAGDPCKI